MKGVVTNRQIFFIVLLTLTMDSFIHIPKDAINASGTGAWFSIVLLSLFFAVGIYLFSSLNSKFHGKTMFEYSKIIVGKAGAFIIGLIYAVYFFVVLIVISYDVTKFIKGAFLFQTPTWTLLILGLSMGAYISSKGITNIGRLCEIYGILLITVGFLVHTSMFFIGDINYIKPLFEVSKIKDYVWGAKDLIFPFLGMEILTIMPFNKTSNKKASVYSVLAIIFVGVFYIIVVETSAMIVGINDILMYENSLVEALRETKLPKFFLLERADLLFLTVGIAAIIGGYCTVYCAVADNAINLLCKINRSLLLIIVGIIAFALCCFTNDEIEKIFVRLIVPIYGIITSFVIPMTLLTIAKVKKL